MAEKVLMIALSPTMETGTIVKWRKGEGEFVEIGDVLCEVETDKATMEYESVSEGTLLKILLQEGQEARIEEPIAVIGEKEEDISALLQEIGKGSTDTMAIKPGGAVKEKAGVPEEAALHDEASASEEAPPSEEGISREERLVAEQAVPSPGAKEPVTADHIKASPLARQLAEQHGIDLALVMGSGPEGRVIKRDIERALERPPVELVQQMQVPGTLRREEITLSGKRKVIAKRISESKFSAPHYYLRTVVMVDGLMYARSQLNRGRDEKISLNAFLIKFTAEALKWHRSVNAGWAGDRIILFGSVDMGLAVAQQDGLITPIVRDCEKKGIIQIDSELKLLVDKALKGRLSPGEYTGATFTISNLGSLGIQEFTAIINPPGSAILAVGQIRKEPVVGEDDSISVRSTMTLTLSCDHRVFDGAEGALFLKDLKDMMENPIRTLY